MPRSKEFCVCGGLRSHRDWALAADRSVPGRVDAGVFNHQNDRALGGARAMEDGARYRESLARAKLDRLVFKIDQELTLDHEEELVLFVVLVPVVLTLDDAHADVPADPCMVYALTISVS